MSERNGSQIFGHLSNALFLLAFHLRNISKFTVIVVVSAGI